MRGTANLPSTYKLLVTESRLTASALLSLAAQLETCSTWPKVLHIQVVPANVSAAAYYSAASTTTCRQKAVLDPSRSDASQCKLLLKPLASPSHLRHEHYITGAEQQQQQQYQQQQRSLSASARTAVTDANTQAARTPQSRVVLYRGAYMQPFRLLVRFKIFQLVGIASLAIPINTFLVEGSVEGVQMVMAISLVIGCAAASTALWYYSRRYVGELSLCNTQKACFSVLDFWGNREDTVVDIDRILPPLKDISLAARAELAELPLIPVDVEADRQYLISLRHGIFVDKAKLFQLLEGRPAASANNMAKQAAEPKSI